MLKRFASAGLAVLIGVAPFGAAAQNSDFEALVEDALNRNATGAPPAGQPPIVQPPAGQPPASAVPPRLEVAPAQPPVPAPQPPPPEPQVQTPQPAPAPASPADPGPRPYTPPVRPETPESTTGTPPAEPSPDANAVPAAPAIGEPGAPATAAPGAPAPVSGPPERAQSSLGIDEVNSATYAEHAEAIRGASPLILKAQVLLDRAGASPGVIDALNGGNVAKAIAAVETVLGLPIDGELDPQVWAALGGDNAPDVLVRHVVTPEDLVGPFVPEIPSDYALQAQMQSLAFTSPAEMFAERFHMDIKLLQALNPGADFGTPGTTIIVAAIEGPAIVGKIARIEADKARRQIRAYDAQNRLVVAYPATIGSADNPSPSGTHRVEAVAPDPVYYYDPSNFVQGQNTKALQLPPGPNNPVGTMWIDLSEPSYGIHGTPEPSRIDKTGSHGCIRLTNWDAQELAGLVEVGVVVSFVE